MRGSLARARRSDGMIGVLLFWDFLLRKGDFGGYERSFGRVEGEG